MSACQCWTGWRHLRFLLLYSPTHLFLLPGALLMLAGLTVLTCLLPGPVVVFGRSWGATTMTLACVVTLMGLQIIFFGLAARPFSLTEHLDGEQDRLLRWLGNRFKLEHGIRVGFLLFAVGLGIDVFLLAQWIRSGSSMLHEIRTAIYATAFLAMGMQMVFGSFFLSFLQFRKSIHEGPTAAAGIDQPAPGSVSLPAQADGVQAR